MKQATKTVSNLKYDLIVGDRASGVYNASEIFRGAGCWGTSQKKCRHCIQICYLHNK
jgi:hypothetical protein